MDSKDIKTLLWVKKGNVTSGEMARNLGVKPDQQYRRLRRLVDNGYLNPNLPGRTCTRTLTDKGYEAIGD